MKMPKKAANNKFWIFLLLFPSLFIMTINSQNIVNLNHCGGEIKCMVHGSCKMMDSGFCDIRNCTSSHGPRSTKMCIRQGNDDRECVEQKSLVNDCQEKCRAIPLVVCSCEVEKRNGGWIVNDCSYK